MGTNRRIPRGHSAPRDEYLPSQHFEAQVAPSFSSAGDAWVFSVRPRAGGRSTPHEEIEKSGPHFRSCILRGSLLSFNLPAFQHSPPLDLTATMTQIKKLDELTPTVTEKSVQSGHTTENYSGNNVVTSGAVVDETFDNRDNSTADSAFKAKLRKIKSRLGIEEIGIERVPEDKRKQEGVYRIAMLVSSTMGQTWASTDRSAVGVGQFDGSDDGDRSSGHSDVWAWIRGRGAGHYTCQPCRDSARLSLLRPRCEVWAAPDG